MKIAISVPDPVFERAERAAQHLGVTRSRLYSLALDTYLKQMDLPGDPVTVALNDVYSGDQPADEFVTAATQRVFETTAW